jgi:hypothetical protein
MLNQGASWQAGSQRVLYFYNIESADSNDDGKQVMYDFGSHMRKYT